MEKQKTETATVGRKSRQRLASSAGSFTDPITPGSTDRLEILQRWDRLSPKEKQVAMLLALGFDTADICRQMVIVERTLRTHLGNIFQKMYVANRYQLVAALWLFGIMRTNRPPISHRDPDFFSAWN